MSYPSLSIAPEGSSLKATVNSELPEYHPLAKVISVEGQKLDFRSVLDPTQTVGSGLDDITTSGSQNNPNRVVSLYEVKITTAAGTDEFQWRRLTNGAWTDWSSDIAMTGSAQELEDGISVTFAATTGHDLNDEWQFTVREQSYLTDGEHYPYDIMYRVIIGFQNGESLYFDIQQVTNQASWTADDTGHAKALSDIRTWLP